MLLPDLPQPFENSINSTFQLFTRARVWGDGGTRAHVPGKTGVNSIEELNYYNYQSLTSPSHPLGLTTLQAGGGEARP